MFHEEELFSGDLCGTDEGSVMGNHGLEFSAQILTLDPVDHEATETGTGSNAVLNVDVIEVVADVFPAFDEILVWSTTYITWKACSLAK